MERTGEYFVRRLVGEGGMGKVYEAEERLSRRRVALKVLRAELARSDDGRRLFLSEMQILAHLEHPSVVRSLASCFSFIVFFLGFFWAGWDKEKQSWHDKIAGTIVVQVPKGVSLL